MTQLLTYGNVTLRQYQHDSVEEIKDHIRKQLKREIENTPAFFEGYVGCGKTMVIGALAAHCNSVNCKLLVLARTGELVEQNSIECRNMGAQASIFSASLGTKSVFYNTVVGTEGTVVNHLNKEFSKWIPRIICVDEGHQVPWKDVIENGNTAYSRIINHFKSANPNVVIVGLTGSPYRGVESIKGPFWKRRFDNVVGREFLVKNDFLVPTIFGFGHDDVQYDLSEFNQISESGTSDFSSEQIEQMHDKMTLSNTQAIMREVQEVMNSRLMALVTCAGKKHCDEAASCVPDDEFAIITESTPAAERREILRAAKNAEKNSRGTFRYKYIFQVSALSVGVNVPTWCTSVILRRIGSLTLLTQLLGRGMRLLKPEHIAIGLVKNDHLVLDYTGTMDAMAELFNDPILEDAQLSHAKQSNDYITCEICGTKNSPHARRCVGTDTVGDQPDNRCGKWWQFRTCDDEQVNGIVLSRGCGHRNDIAARECRNCGKYLIDPNAKLTQKHYTDQDWKPVKSWSLEVIGRNSDAIKVSYFLDNYGIDGEQEIAEVIYWAIFAGGSHVWKVKFVDYHAVRALRRNAINCKNISELTSNKFWKTPKFITHRKNAKGESIVHGIKFASDTLSNKAS